MLGIFSGKGDTSMTFLAPIVFRSFLEGLRLIVPFIRPLETSEHTKVVKIIDFVLIIVLLLLVRKGK